MIQPVMIQVQGVAKTFVHAGERLAVLQDVTLDVRRGEFLAIVGPSGCGKTTLLTCIAGFEPVDSGTITIDGQAVRQPSPRRVFVFQEPGIFPWLNVQENIGFGLSPDLPADRRAEIVRHHIALVGLIGFETAYPHQLSGGMKQRVEFARALAVEPDALYLDEPFGALDALTRLDMRREIARIWQTTGKTCLLVTHDVEEACALADRIAVMSSRPGTIQAIIDNPLPHPRDPDGADWRQLQAGVYAALGVERRV